MARNRIEKSSKSFSRLTAFDSRRWAASIQFLWLVQRVVKLKFEQTGNQLFFHIVLNFGIDLPVHFGKVSDIPGIVGKNCVHGFRVALMGFDNGLIGK